MSEHFIRWTYHGHGVTAEAICKAPEDADCRLTSVSCDCEAWGEIQRRDDGTIWHKIVDYGDSNEPLWHQVKSSGECNICMFLDEAAEDSGTKSFVIAETPIEPRWSGDWYDWEPIKDAASDAELGQGATNSAPESPSVDGVAEGAQSDHLVRGEN